MKKAVIAVMVAVIMCLSVVGVLALDLFATAEAVSVTSRFFLVESSEAGDEFSMVSENGELVIHITDNTLIYFADYVPLSDECEGRTRMVREVLFGQTLAQVLEGRNMRVTFKEGARIEPTSIMVLFETIATGPALLDPEDILILPEDGYMGIVTLPGDISWDEFELPELNGEIVVNNEILEGAPLPFWYAAENDNVVMVPLGPVAEALGYDVHLDDDEQGVRLGVAIKIWIGATEAHIGRMAPIELSAAPILIDGEIFAPLDFFRNVLNQTAYVFEGQVVIETYSDMA